MKKQVKMARNAMAQDTSTDQIESKELIGKMAWGLVQDTADLKAECEGIANADDFLKELAANFLKEPALAARAETYDALGLPPPDETGAPLSFFLARKSSRRARADAEPFAPPSYPPSL